MRACVYVTFEVATSLGSEFTNEMQLISMPFQILLLYGITVVADATFLSSVHSIPPQKRARNILGVINYFNLPFFKSFLVY